MADSNNKKNKRELRSILFADVVGYTRLMQADEEATHAGIIELVDLFSKGCEKFDGEILETRGDGIFALFASAVNSARFAVEIQDTVEKYNNKYDESRKIRFRIGIHLGDVIKDANYHYGDSVNIAARLEGLADSGGICISGSVYQQIKHTGRLGYEYLGPQKLKNISELIEIYRIIKKTTAAAMIASPRPAPKYFQVEESQKPSVVVIPFRNISGDIDNDYFADGVSEDISTLLSKFRDLMVIGRTTAFAYKSTKLTATQINQQINVRYIVNGSIRTAGNRIRITVELTDARLGNTVWSDRYDRNMDDIFDLQDEASANIAAATAIKIESESSRLALRRPNDLMAYDCLLQGQQRIYRYTKDDNFEARALYDQAMHRDPKYARALAAMSRTHSLDWRYGWSATSEKNLQQAMKLAKYAVEIDAYDARGLSELGYTYLYSKQHDLSLTTYQRAIDINPNDPDILSDMADALAHSGKSDEAIKMMEKAMRLNPFYPDQYLWHLAGAQFNLKKYQEVINLVNRANNPTEGERLLAASHAYLGNQKMAKWFADRVLDAHPGFSLKHWSQILPDKIEAETDHYIEGLRIAGLE